MWFGIWRWAKRCSKCLLESRKEFCMEMQLRRPIMSRVNVGPVERGVSIVTGLALLAYIVKRRPGLGLSLGLLGLDAGYMLYRGATGHCVVYQAMGINRT